MCSGRRKLNNTGTVIRAKRGEGGCCGTALAQAASLHQKKRREEEKMI
jgi:hypothetical protein